MNGGSGTSVAKAPGWDYTKTSPAAGDLTLFPGTRNRIARYNLAPRSNGTAVLRARPQEDAFPRERPMSYCFAFISNDSSLTGCALQPYKQMLTREQGAPHGWGLAYYQAGQPLLRKQPKATQGPLDFTAQAENLRTNVIIGHVRHATVGSQRTENTHPFRYGNWTFAGCGHLEMFPAIKDDLLRSVPDFVRRNIRGKTDTEHLFHLYLSFLHDTGKLDDHRISADVAAQSLWATFNYLNRLIRDRGGEPSPGCYLLSNGSFIIATRQGVPLWVKRHNEHTCLNAAGNLAPVPHLKTAMLMAGDVSVGPGWEMVADNAVVTIDTRLNIEFSDQG